MKKMSDVLAMQLQSPNRLATERYRRGWSQQELAERVGTTPLTVSRWERGVTRPSPYFSHQLCALFEMSAAMLGLVPDPPNNAMNNIIVEEKKREEKYHDPALPLSLTAPLLVGRDEELHTLEQFLFQATKHSLATISGLPGSGKTALVLELVSRPQIREHFDGILWASLGPEVCPLSVFARWGDVLGIPIGRTSEDTSPAEWTRILREAIGQRRFLIVLDDVWHLRDVRQFMVGGLHCSYLLTTCFPQIGLIGMKEWSLILRELDEEKSLQLLRQLAPEAVKHSCTHTRELVRLAGGLPLALTIFGNHLHLQAHNGQPRRIRAALSHLSESHVWFSLNDPLLRTNYAGHDLNEPASIETSIARIDRRLDKNARQALRVLSTFSPKPERFSEGDALSVCQVPAEVLDILSDAGLLESAEAGYYTLHRIVADYGRLHPTL